MKKYRWQDDPVVVLEKAVLPIVSLVPTLIAQRTSGQEIDKDRIDKPFQTAINMLQDTASGMLNERSIPFEPDQIAPILTAATTARAFQSEFAGLISAPHTQEARLELLEKYSLQLIPQIEAALDAFRGLFIGCVIERQYQQAQQADEAIAGLDRISKQIFFISINASVEAARAGEAGRGFQQISSEIRALAQSAQESTRSLANLASGKIG